MSSSGGDEATVVFSKHVIVSDKETYNLQDSAASLANNIEDTEYCEHMSSPEFELPLAPTITEKNSTEKFPQQKEVTSTE